MPPTLGVGVGNLLHSRRSEFATWTFGCFNPLQHSSCTVMLRISLNGNSVVVSKSSRHEKLGDGKNREGAIVSIASLFFLESKPTLPENLALQKCLYQIIILSCYNISCIIYHFIILSFHHHVWCAYIYISIYLFFLCKMWLKLYVILKGILHHKHLWFLASLTSDILTSHDAHLDLRRHPAVSWRFSCWNQPCKLFKQGRLTEMFIKHRWRLWKMKITVVIFCIVLKCFSWTM